MSHVEQSRPFGLLIQGTFVGTVVGLSIGSIYSASHIFALCGATVGVLAGAVVDAVCAKREIRRAMASGARWGCLAAAVPAFWLQMLPALCGEFAGHKSNTLVEAILLAEPHVVLLLTVILVGGVLGAALAVGAVVLTGGQAAFRTAAARALQGYVAGLAVSLAVIVLDFYLGYTIDTATRASLWQHLSLHVFTCLFAAFVSASLWGLLATPGFSGLKNERRTNGRRLYSSERRREPTASELQTDPAPKSPQQKAEILERMTRRAAEGNSADA